MAFGIMDRGRGEYSTEVEAIEEYLLGMYAESWTEREAGNKKNSDTQSISEFLCLVNGAKRLLFRN